LSVERFYRHLYGGESGLMAMFSGTRGPDGELEKDSPRTRYFDYPQKIARAVAHAAAESEAGREVWHCAHLLTKGRRVKENAAPVRTLWGDLDGAEVPNGPLKPTGVVESSRGRFHCYWRLSDEVPPEIAEDLNKRLAAASGADPSGFDLTQLLRVPGTVNHKYPQKPVVKVLHLDGTRFYSPSELDDALPEIEDKPEAPRRGAPGEPPVVLDGPALRVWRGEDTKLTESGKLDRSASLVKIGRALFDAGAARAVIEPALEERDRALGWNKYTGRRDASECYRGIVDELERNGRNGKVRISVSRGRTGEDGLGEPEDTPGREDRRNQGDRLIGYALEALDEDALFADQHGDPHALIDGSPVPLNSRCYSWLRSLMWKEEQRAVNGEYLKTAAGTLAAQAEFSGEVRELHTRAAWHEGILFYELRPGKVVRVGAGGWTFEARPPVLFRRYPNLKPLPDPEAGGSLDGLLSLVNLKTERDRRLFTAYAVTVPLSHVGRPILSASGPMGSGKTTAGRAVKRLWDPTAPETVRYDPRDFLQKAGHCYIPMLDNLSTLPDSAADTLCRLVTGEADSKRKLYTDDEDVIIELRRAVILNGINAPTDRGDVLDRSLVVELERIPDGERKTEEEMWAAFEREHPSLLGAALDLLGRAIACKSSLQLSRRPRLADWGEYAAAVYEVMGWGAETFLSDWDEVVKVQNRSTLDGSPVAQAIIRFMEDRDEYSGTSTELHKELEAVAEKIGVSVSRDKEWPKSARWLWRKMQLIVPLLVTAGIEATRSEEKRGTAIALRKGSTDDATNATGLENVTGKPDAGGNTAPSNATANATNAPNATANATRNPADRAEGGISGNSGIRNGSFSGPVSFDAKPGEDVTVAELKARRGELSPEDARRVRELVRKGFSERVARQEVAAKDHPIDCECEVCL
jgi:hypothetical protein